MIKRFLLIGLISISLLFNVFSFFTQLDFAYERTDLKKMISMQKQAINFMVAITNRMLGSCNISIDSVNEIAAESGYSKLGGGIAPLSPGIGPFDIKTSGDNIIEISPRSSE